MVWSLNLHGETPRHSGTLRESLEYFETLWGTSRYFQTLWDTPMDVRFNLYVYVHFRNNVVRGKFVTYENLKFNCRRCEWATFVTVDSASLRILTRNFNWAFFRWCTAKMNIKEKSIFWKFLMGGFLMASAGQIARKHKWLLWFFLEKSIHCMGLKLFALYSATNVEYKTIFLFHFCPPLPLICIACCIVVKRNWPALAPR